MNKVKERELFQNWYKLVDPNFADFYRGEDGEYNDVNIEWMWRAWSYRASIK